MKIKNILFIVLGLIFMLLLIGTSESSAEIRTGTDGDVTWTFDTETGILTYSGTGAITEPARVDPSTELDEITTKIVIGGGITDVIDAEIENCSALEEIVVDDNNANYSSMDGCLYSKDKTKFIAWPRQKAGSIVIPESVTSIRKFAFFDASKLTSVTIPNSVTDIGRDAFYRSGPDLEEMDTTIYCRSDSTVKQYIDDVLEQQDNLNMVYVIDDDAPTITNVTQDGLDINIEANDGEGVGIKAKGYSLDGENWVESNKLTVEDYGTYTVYVRDKLYNVSSKKVTVEKKEEKEEEEEEEDKDNQAKPDKDEDNQAKTVIPQTGEKATIVFIVAVLAVCFVLYKKNKKYRIK